MVYKSGQIFLPFCHNSRVWQTGRRTDGQTDWQNSHHNTASALLPRGKKRSRSRFDRVQSNTQCHVFADYNYNRIV